MKLSGLFIGARVLTSLPNQPIKIPVLEATVQAISEGGYLKFFGAPDDEGFWMHHKHCSGIPLENKHLADFAQGWASLVLEELKISFRGEKSVPLIVPRFYHEMQYLILNNRRP